MNFFMNKVAAALVATLLLCLLITVGCTNLADNNLDRKVAGTLSRHPEGDEISRWYATLPGGSLEHDAAQWILAWLPESDLASLHPGLLKEHVQLACDTYRKAPWRANLPRETWLHFVVPHRVSQEPLQPWRSTLQAELAPVVAPYQSMEEAALAVNRWCRQQATFISTSGRDMGPLTTLKRGLGRCEEEMILTVCAMRAAGIPARTCSTPYWTFIDNNHAWVEVWADNGWYYAESCDDRRCLNDAWFSGAASRAGFVRSTGYGEFDPRPEPLYRANDGVTVINSTAVYTDPFLLRASVAGHPETKVNVNVLNFGTIRAIARLDGDMALSLGPGSFALTAAAPDDSGDLLFKTITGEPGQVIEVALDPATDRYDTETNPGFWLTYPEAGARPRREDICVTDDVDRHHRLLVAADKANREKLRTLDETETAVLDSLPADLREEWDIILAKPCESFSPLVRLLTWYREPAAQQALTWLLADADDKDLLELDERIIRSHVDLSLAAGGDLPDEVFREGVLALRISREAASNWREEIPVIEWPATTDPAAIRQHLLDAFGDQWIVSERTYFGNPVPPNHTFILGRGTETDLKVAFVGLCRRNGMPARYRHGTVEIWQGAWQEIHPLPQDDEAPEENETAGWVDLGLTRDGVLWPEAESYQHFMVSRPGDGLLETPWWDPKLGLQKWDAGEYWFCGTVRVPGGSAFGRLTRFKVESGDTTVVHLPVDMDVGGWDPAALVDAELEESLMAIWPDAAAKLPSAGLFFIFEPGEPATRMIPVLGRLKDRLASRGLEVIPVMGPGAAGSWRVKLQDAGLSGAVYQEAASTLFNWLSGPVDHGPVVMLVLPGVNDGKPVFLRSGLDTGIDFSVHMALDLNSEKL